MPLSWGGRKESTLTKQQRYRFNIFKLTREKRQNTKESLRKQRPGSKRGSSMTVLWSLHRLVNGTPFWYQKKTVLMKKFVFLISYTVSPDGKSMMQLVNTKVKVDSMVSVIHRTQTRFGFPCQPWKNYFRQI